MLNLIIQEVKQIQLVNRSTDDFPTSSCDWLKQKLEYWFNIINNLTNSKSLKVHYLLCQNY